MADSYSYAGLLLLIGLVGLAAVLSNQITERLRVPAPVLLLAAAAIAAQLVPALHPDQRSVHRLVTAALVLILFDGGLHLGWSRFRQAARPIALVGVLGTFLTTAGAALLAHWGIGLAWYPAVLVATAVAPTDPAVVFALLGRREIVGRSGSLLEGESGANDPVGIALMAALLSAGGLSGHALVRAAGEFGLQLGVGALVGILGGRVLLWAVRRLPLPSEGLYPVRTLAAALVLYGLATVAHGSGFLAVFLAGIYLGDRPAPFQREVRWFHAAAGSLGEIVAFVALGLTVRLADLARPEVWLPGLALAVALTVLIRPAAVGSCLLRSGFTRAERAFVLFAGLKGAVPILLGSLLLDSALPDAARLFGIVVIVVVFSVLVQGGLLSTVARLVGLPIRTVQPQPWSVDVRLPEQPTDLHRITVRAGAPAAGRPIADLPEDARLSLLIRDGQLLPVTGEVVLQPADEVVILAGPEVIDGLRTLFGDGTA